MNWARHLRRIFVAACLTGAAACGWGRGGADHPAPYTYLPLYAAGVVLAEIVVIRWLFNQPLWRSALASFAANAAVLAVGLPLVFVTGETTYAGYFLADGAGFMCALLISAVVNSLAAMAVCRMWRRKDLVVTMIIFSAVAWGAVGRLFLPFRSFSSSMRSKPSRALADMRSYATAIETYYVDFNTYTKPVPFTSSPFWKPGNAALEAAVQKHLGTVPTTLTTPIAYVTSLFPDPYAPIRGMAFAYHSNGMNWILVSAGPDEDYDFDPAADFSNETTPTERLLQKTYDPTNGAKSGGDMWRLRQCDHARDGSP